MSRHWLEQEPTTKKDLAVDCISREAVERIINKWLSHSDYELKDHIYSMTEKIHNLPSVTPQLSSELEKNSKKLEKDFGELDCISREQAQTEIEMNASRYTIAKERGGMGQVEWSDQLIKVSDAVNIIRELPSVTPQKPVIRDNGVKDELNRVKDELEPTTKNNLGVDCISRQAVIDEMEKRHAEGDCITKGFIKNMPSVTSQEPRWIPVSEKLPEPFTFVNATCRSLVDDREDWVIETVYLPIPKEANKHGYSDWGNIPMLNWGEAEVIAWVERIIPQPYKAETEDKE